jgi:hypothetical protein
VSTYSHDKFKPQYGGGNDHAILSPPPPQKKEAVKGNVFLLAKVNIN